MSGYAILLFLHVSGAILIFTGIATLIFGVAAMRLASNVDQVRAIARPLLVGRKIGLEHISVIDVFTIVGIVLTDATGLYMATNWGFGRGWVEVAIASFALMAPVGPLVINPRLQAIGRAADATTPGPLDGSLLSRTHDPLLAAALLSLTAWLLGIVFLMTTKPELATAVVAMVVALGLGLAASLLVRCLGRRGRDQASPVKIGQ
jgi:hypothetical protein